MYCAKCGTALRAGAKFCLSCGTRVLTVPAEEPAASGIKVRPEPHEDEATLRASAQSTEKGPLEWALEPWKKYAVFRGRARRKEFWFFHLFCYIATFFLALLVNDDFASLFILAFYLPSLAVSVRRLHDTDRRGWWFLCPVANFIFFCFAGTRGKNRFGADPKAAVVRHRTTD
jgi:uncharacterized membrane protein YhaH (DUF805 family)